ncbi:MAG: hypothetical protein ABI333_09590 [bacterium]
MGTPEEDAGPWSPPVTNAGTPGWRDSETPWEPEECETLVQLDLWSYDDGVFVLQDYEDGTGGSGCLMYQRISYNDGSGWTDYYEQCSMTEHELGSITGFPGGQLMAAGSGRTAGPVLWIYEDDAELSADLDVLDMFVVNENLAYAIDHEKAYRYDGIDWEPVPAYFPYELDSIWADATDLYGVGPLGTIISYAGVDWVVHDSGTIESLSTVWGFGGNNVWVGSAESGLLLHYDGVAWTPHQWPVRPPGADATIQGMWGQDGVLFFHTHTQLVRWDGTEFTDLSTWPCEELEIAPGEIVCDNGLLVESIWGNSPTELFVGLRDTSIWPGDCSALFLLWFDGVEYHWL